MPEKYWVGGLKTGTNQAELHGFFSRFGEVKECSIPLDKEGEPKRFGFITLDWPKGMERRRPPLGENHLKMNGSSLNIRPCLEQSGDGKPTRKVCIRNLPPTASDGDVSTVFSVFGEVEKAEIVKDKKHNKSRGFGFCTFKDVKSAEKACAASVKVRGQPVSVEPKIVNKGESFRHSVRNEVRVSQGKVTEEDLEEEKKAKRADAKVARSARRKKKHGKEITLPPKQFKMGKKGKPRKGGQSGADGEGEAKGGARQGGMASGAAASQKSARKALMRDSKKVMIPKRMRDKLAGGGSEPPAKRQRMS